MANEVFMLLTVSAFILSVVFLVLLVFIMFKPSAHKSKKPVKDELKKIRDQIDGDEAEIY